MKLFPRLLLRTQFEIVEIGDEVTAVSVGDNSPFSGVIVLKNESTRFMFEKLQEGITLPELIKACMDRYTDNPVEEVGPQVISFLDQLKEKNLLMADREHGVKSKTDKLQQYPTRQQGHTVTCRPKIGRTYERGNTPKNSLRKPGR